MYKYTFKTGLQQLHNHVLLAKDKGMMTLIPQETLLGNPFRTVIALLGIVELDHPLKSSNSSTGFCSL